MAAVASAWHFNPPSQSGDRWQTADGTELHDTLARVVKERIGLELQL
jgi:hypothetical protein